MSCGCSNTTPFYQGFSTQFYSATNCQSSPSNTPVISDNVIYDGSNLTCSGINYQDSLTVALQKLDTAACAAMGDYSTYNTYCLAPITTQQQFVETISNYVCTLNSNYTTFSGTTFPAYQTSISAQLAAITNPGITCSIAGVTSADSLVTVLNKYCTSFSNFNTAISLSGVNWSQCFSVSTPPTTIAGAFSTVLNQICQVQSGAGGGLPTFNNTSSCLSGGTTNDSLVTTINLIKTQLCTCPTFNINTLTWNCVTKPSGAGVTDLQDAFSALMAKVDSLSQQILTGFSGDFTITSTNPSSSCAGKSIALTTPATTSDRLVASTPSDTAPGTLQQKVTAGTNITLDYTTTPGQMIINSSGGGTNSYQVKVNSGDTAPGYLGVKVEGGTDPAGIVTITPSVDTVNQKVSFAGSLNIDNLITAILTELADNPAMQEAWCAANSNCPSSCPAPTNISVTYSSGLTTTTTTTTTSTSSTTTTTTTT
jgi:hypothetical protein